MGQCGAPRNVETSSAPRPSARIRRFGLRHRADPAPADGDGRPARRREVGAGSAGVALTVYGPWTVGMLANHIWSYAGNSGRQDVSNTTLQPFVAYTWPNAWTVSVQSETSYNWKT